MLPNVVLTEVLVAQGALVDGGVVQPGEPLLDFPQVVTSNHVGYEGRHTLRLLATDLANLEAGHHFRQPGSNAESRSHLINLC